MPVAKFKLYDHTFCDVTVTYFDKICGSACTFFDDSKGYDATCRLFDRVLQRVPSSKDEPNQSPVYLRCAHCLNAVRPQFSELKNDGRVTLILQRNLQKRSYRDNDPSISSFEVEVNTVLKGYNEFRLTFTNDDPNGLSSEAKKQTTNPEVVVPLTIDLGDDDAT